MLLMSKSRINYDWFLLAVLLLAFLLLGFVIGIKTATNSRVQNGEVVAGIYPVLNMTVAGSGYFSFSTDAEIEKAEENYSTILIGFRYWGNIQNVSVSLVLLSIEHSYGGDSEYIAKNWTVFLRNGRSSNWVLVLAYFPDLPNISMFTFSLQSFMTEMRGD